MAQFDWVGKKLGDRYQVEEMIGQGGMSAVYKATDPNLKRVVAIKLIHPHLSDNEEFVIRFKEEATAVAQLRHPNIVQVFDFNSDDGVYYMVLEFVAGETLQARLKRLNAAGRVLPLPEALKFAAQVCDAVDYAHQRGMIHRDIKPANIMLDVYGKAILMDFGIAKIIGGQYHTATGATLGTALYMSPEQIRGDRIDERSDIYSIGVALFEMVSGRPPYEADSAMTLMMMHLNDPIPDLRHIQPDTPPELVAVIERALSKDRDARFQSAAEMGAALRKIADRLASPDAGATVVERATAQAPPRGRAPADSPLPAPSVPAEPALRTPAAVPDVPALRTEQPAAPLLARLKESPLLLAGVGGLILLVLVAVLATSLLGNDGNEAAAQAPTTTATPAALAQGVSDQGASETDAAATQAAGDTATAAAIADAATPTPEPSATPAPTQTSAPTAQPTDTAAPTDTPAPTSYLPTATPTAYLPTATSPPPPTATQASGPYARIRQITIQGDTYVVDYETIGFTETAEQWHTHFFFNTVPPEQAGLPASGPWQVYYGPNPFTLYRVSDRPEGATQMCVRVANADHTLYNSAYSGINTGNCVNLP